MKPQVLEGLRCIPLLLIDFLFLVEMTKISVFKSNVFFVVVTKSPSILSIQKKFVFSKMPTDITQTSHRR